MCSPLFLSIPLSLWELETIKSDTLSQITFLPQPQISFPDSYGTLMVALLPVPQGYSYCLLQVSSLTHIIAYLFVLCLFVKDQNRH